MAKRVTCLVVVLGVSCVFTPRPMIPLSDDAGSTIPGLFTDAGRGAGGDAGIAGGGADASAPYDVPLALDGAPAAAPDASANFDSLCHRVPSDGGDAGYLDDEGSPCDPEADGGARDVPDASDADASRDTSGDGLATETR